MAKKPTQAQKNAGKISELLKQKVSGSNGFLKKEFKTFIAQELISAANRQGKSIKGKESLQNRYDKFKISYDKLFGAGMTGNGLYTGQIEKNYKKDTAKGTRYFIQENGKEKQVSYAELGYKLEMLAHNLSTKNDVAFTKIRPIYKLVGKGKYDIIIVIPNLSEIDNSQMTVKDIFDWFDENNIVPIGSDPNKVKTADKFKWQISKKHRQNRMKKNKTKFFNQWKEQREKSKKKPTKKKAPLAKKKPTKKK